MKPKKSSIHQQALDFVGKKHDPDSMEMIFETLFFLCRLSQLDPKAVSVTFPPNDDEGTLICYLFPFESDDGKGYELLPDSVEIKCHLVHDQRSAAKFCKVSERTLQRWMKESDLKPIKLGKQRIFKESDLTALVEQKSIDKISGINLNLDL